MKGWVAFGGWGLQDSAFFPFVVEIAGIAVRLHALVFGCGFAWQRSGQTPQRANRPAAHVCLLPSPPVSTPPRPCLTHRAGGGPSFNSRSFISPTGLAPHHLAKSALNVEPRLLVVRASGRNPGTRAAAPCCLGTNPSLPSRVRPRARCLVHPDPVLTQDKICEHPSAARLIGRKAGTHKTCATTYAVDGTGPANIDGEPRAQLLTSSCYGMPRKLSVTVMAGSTANRRFRARRG